MQIQIYTNTYTGLWKQSFTSHTDYFCMAGKRLEHFFLSHPITHIHTSTFLSISKHIKNISISHINPLRSKSS